MLTSRSIVHHTVPADHRCAKRVLGRCAQGYRRHGGCPRVRHPRSSSSCFCSLRRTTVDGLHAALLGQRNHLHTPSKPKLGLNACRRHCTGAAHICMEMLSSAAAAGALCAPVAREGESAGGSHHAPQHTAGRRLQEPLALRDADVLHKPVRCSKEAQAVSCPSSYTTQHHMHRFVSAQSLSPLNIDGLFFQLQTSRNTM